MAHASKQEAMADCHAVDHDLPTDWTCPNAGDVCISVGSYASSLAAYCCPQGTDCSKIACLPASGHVLPYYGKLAPNPRVFMKDTNHTIPLCGWNSNMGCPLGYHPLIPGIDDVSEASCIIYGFRAKTPNKGSATEASFVVTLPTPSPTGMVSFSGGPTPSATQDTNTTAPQDKDSGHSNASVIAGATIGGAVGILAIVLLVMIYLRYIKKHANQETNNKGQEGTEYWSYDGRKDAQGKSMSRWSNSTLAQMEGSPVSEEHKIGGASLRA